jgi:predicted dehydrogenase
MTIHIGLIGCGGISRAHARGYLAHPDLARVTAVADVADAAAAERAAQLDATAYRDYRDLLADDAVDAVDICLPHHLHANAIVAAAEAGKHVLCEKPLCLTTAEADRIRRAVDAAGVTLMCAHNNLYLPAVAQARELLDAGALGRVYELRTTDCFRSDFRPDTMGWRADRRTSGGGELIDTGYHPTYLLLYLASDAPTDVTAMLSTHRLSFMDGEDSARVLVRFAGGALGELVTSWAYSPPPYAEKFSVVGERGSLWSDGTALHQQIDGAAPVVTEHPAVDATAAEIAAFATCLRDGTRPIHSVAEGTAVLEVILAAYRSAEQRQVATIAGLQA